MLTIFAANIIVTLVIFGFVCVIGSIVIMALLGAFTGQVIGNKIYRWKNGNALTPLEFVRQVSEQPIPKPTTPLPVNESPTVRYFIKLGKAKVPIEASEVKDAQKQGYEVLIE